MMVTAVEHGAGLVLGQVQVGGKTNEIPAVRELTRALDLGGRVVTLDALHAQQETARALVEDCGADCVVTAVKDSQETMLDDLRGSTGVGRAAPTAAGRRPAPVSSGAVAPCSTSAARSGTATAPCTAAARRSASRERHLVKQDAGSRETACGLTSLGPGQAGPEDVAALVRRHWEIENRLHCVRDFTCDCDEDRCRARVGNLPRNLACLTNAAISIVRHGRRFEHLPPASQYCAARPQEALDAVLNPPSR